MDFETLKFIFTALGSAVGGGFAGNYITKLLENKNKKEERQFEKNKSGQDLAFETLTAQIASLTTRVEFLEKENARLRLVEDEKEREINLLQTTVLMMQTNWDNFPFPVWFKDLNGRMRYFNKRYADVFITPNGKNPLLYLGSTDKEFWGDELGAEYILHDVTPKRLHKPWRGIEKTKLGEDFVYYDVLKYIEKTGGTPIGFRGIAFDVVPDYIMKQFYNEKNI
jgi:hypothetical protein